MVESTASLVVIESDGWLVVVGCFDGGRRVTLTMGEGWP